MGNKRKDVSMDGRGFFNMKKIYPARVRCKVFRNKKFKCLEKDINDFFFPYSHPNNIDIIIADSNLIMDGEEYLMVIFYEEYLD